jgi:Cu/Ag efflux protein CusF
MQIDTNMTPNVNSAAAPAAVHLVAPPVVNVPVAQVDTAAFHQSLDLEQELGRAEDARAEKVELALNRIGQVEWPPMTVIRRIGNLLATHIRQSPES